jgi:hypothetical protein
MRAPRDDASDRIGMTLMCCLAVSATDHRLRFEADQKGIRIGDGNRLLRSA